MYLPHHRIRLLFLPSPSTSFPSLHAPSSILFLLTFSLAEPRVRYPTSFCYVLFSLFFPSLSQLPRIASSHQRDDPHAPLFYADLVLFSTWYTRGSMSAEGGEARPLFFLHPAPGIRASESRWSSETTQQRVHPSDLPSLSLPSIGKTATIKKTPSKEKSVTWRRDASGRIPPPTSCRPYPRLSQRACDEGGGPSCEKS